MTGPDIYGDVQVLGVQLERMGLGEWKTKLEDDMIAGATSGEILTYLRFHLRELLEEQNRLPDAIKEGIQRLIDAINRTGV